MKAAVACLLLAGCAAANAYPASDDVYWDLPTTGWYWVADGVQPGAIVEVARVCGAHAEGSVANYGVVPPGFSMHVFRFVGDNTPEVTACVLGGLNAVPALKTYLK